MARVARFLQAEDDRHDIPPAVFGSRSRARPTPFILGDEQIAEIVSLAAQSGYRTLRRQTYSTLFALPLRLTQESIHAGSRGFAGPTHYLAPLLFMRAAPKN